MCSVYIIQSVKDGSFYIGKTSDLQERLQWHNDLERNIAGANRKIHWHQYYALEVLDMKTAGRIENHIKRMKSRAYIHNLKKYPEMGRKLIEKYS